mgnify:CR=1 FL=1
MTKSIKSIYSHIARERAARRAAIPARERAACLRAAITVGQDAIRSIDAGEAAAAQDLLAVDQGFASFGFGRPHLRRHPVRRLVRPHPPDRRQGPRPARGGPVPTRRRPGRPPR